MHPLIKAHRTELKQLCRRYHVKRLELFGSAVTEEFDRQRSDLDFLVEFERTGDMNVADQYFGLWDGLKTLFQKDVDLVTTRAMRNPYFIQAVNKTRTMLYAA